MEDKNIFKDAKFSDKFLTHDNRIAIYLDTLEFNKLGTKVNIYRCWIEGDSEYTDYISTGELYGISKTITDNGIEILTDEIVAPYKEPIDEKKLDELANESMYRTPLLKIEGSTYKQGFKAGYRKALNYE